MPAEVNCTSSNIARGKKKAEIPDKAMVSAQETIRNLVVILIRFYYPEF